MALSSLRNKAAEFEGQVSDGLAEIAIVVHHLLHRESSPHQLPTMQHTVELTAQSHWIQRPRSCKS